MAKAKPKLTEVVTKVHDLLHPLDSDDRKKVFQSVFALLGESTGGMSGSNSKTLEETRHIVDFKVGPRATLWMQQHDLTKAMLEEVFRFQDGSVEVIATDVPGKSNMAKSRSCYLLTGVQALLGTDSPTFQDKSAVGLCEHMDCYDPANNAKMRGEMGMSGSKKNGFTLTAPCLRAAAALIKEMVPNE